MGVIYTSLGPDKKPDIYPVPSGESPDAVAEKRGLKDAVWAYCESESEAERQIASDPTGKMEPI